MPLLFGLVIGVVPLALMSGLVGGLPIIAGALVLGVVASQTATNFSRPASSGPSWAASGPFRFVPAQPHPPSSQGRLIQAIGWVEARQLFPASLAFATGIGFSILIVVLFGLVWVRDDGGEMASFVEDFPLMMYPLAGLTIVAVHRARTRARRDGVEEIFVACPVNDEVRNAGHIATMWVPAVAAIVMVAAMMVGHWARSNVQWGPFGARQAVLLVGGVLLVVGATALGVVLGRWAPWPLVPPIALVAIGLFSGLLADSGAIDADGQAQLSLISVTEDVDVRFTAPHWVAHHLWVLALVVFTVVLALWRRDRRGPFGLALAVTMVLGAIAGYAATRPTTAADVARLTSLIAEPERHQECVQVGVLICTYSGDGGLVDVMRPHVAAVLAGAPAGVAADERVVRQGTMYDPAEFDDAVASSVPDRRCDRRTIPVGLRDDDSVYEALRFWVAFSVTGIAADLDHAPTVDLSGQARGVVAIWLATREMTSNAAERMSSTSRPDSHDGESRPWPGATGAGPTPVTWALTDLELGRQLIKAGDDMTAAVHANWATLIDPETTTDEAAALLGLDPVGPPRGITPVLDEC